MPNSSEHRALWFAVLLAASAYASRAEAQQQQPQGFALERFYPSAPGGGWFVMDDLDMRGGLGGAMALTAGYAMKPLRVTDGSQHLAVVSDRAFTDFGFAVTYDRWRLYLNLDMPLATSGQSGTVGNYHFTARSVDLGSNPDTLSDARIGLDARLVGSARSPFRLGAGAQLIVPNGDRAKKDTDGTFLGAYYDTDGTYRAMVRVLFAGDVGLFTYAGQLGVHVRPLDDSPTPGSPQGSELLFGVAAGSKLPIRSNGRTAVIVGPEIYGETAFRSFLGSTATGLEALLTGRLEGTGDEGAQMRVKLGGGVGINQHFGTPEWRIALGVEVFAHNTDRDKDGIPDGRDACPDTPGIKTADPKTNGCPVDRDGDGIPDAEDACPASPGPKTNNPNTSGCPPSIGPVTPSISLVTPSIGPVTPSISLVTRSIGPVTPSISLVTRSIGPVAPSISLLPLAIAAVNDAITPRSEP